MKINYLFHRLIITLLLYFPIFSIQAQIEHPRISPVCSVKQEIGLSYIEIIYGRPSARGRKVFGELVPYERIWRVGANESTKITFSDSVVIDGQLVPPGTFALYAFPYEKNWEIVLHKNTSHWGDGRKQYDQKEDQLRFRVMPTKNPMYQETLLISFDEITLESATIKIIWEELVVSFKAQFDTRSKMNTVINQAIYNNPSGLTYYEAARYYQEQNVNLDKALLWLEEAKNLLGDTYFIHRVWALTLSQQMKFKEAIYHATVSRDLAEIEGKDEFVRANQRNILEWKSYNEN